MGPGFESLKVHQENEECFCIPHFLWLRFQGKNHIRTMGQRKNEPLFSDVGSPRRLRRHEERSDEVAPESAFLHLIFLGAFVG